jgi:hypothetical protein
MISTQSRLLHSVQHAKRSSSGQSEQLISSATVTHRNVVPKAKAPSRPWDRPAATHAYAVAARERLDHFDEREAERLAEAGLALDPANAPRADLLEVRPKHGPGPGTCTARARTCGRLSPWPAPPPYGPGCSLGGRGDGPVAEQRGAHRTRADRGGQTRRCERRVDRGACRSPWLDGHGVAQHRYRVRGHRRPANRRGRVPPVRSTRASICRCFRPGHMRDLPSYWWPWGGSRRPPLMSIARLPWGHLSASSKHGSPDACSPSSVGNRTPQRCSRMRCTARPRAAIGPARPVSPC